MSGVGNSPFPDRPSLGCRAGARCPFFFGRGGCARGGPSPTSQRTFLRGGVARFRGGRRAPGGEGSCLCEGCPELSIPPPPFSGPSGLSVGPATRCLWVWCAGVGARTPTVRLALRALRSVGQQGWVRLGVPRRVGSFLASSRVPWFGAFCQRVPGLRHPVAVVPCHLSVCLDCGRRSRLSGVPCRPALLRHTSTGLVALGALVGFPFAVVP